MEIPESGHPVAQVAVIGGPEDEAGVVGHEAVGEDWHGESLAGLVDDGVVVIGLVEDPGVGVAAIGDVVAVVGPGGADGVWHEIKDRGLASANQGYCWMFPFPAFPALPDFSRFFRPLFPTFFSRAFCSG